MFDFLGKGLIIPFERDRKSDFASATELVLLKSAIQQTLGTVGASDFTQGEVPWRTEFGSLLHLLRHQANDVALQELAKVYVTDALRNFNPRIVVTSLGVQRIEDGQFNRLLIRLRYSAIQRNVPGNIVLFEAIDQDVFVPLNGGVGIAA